MTLSRLPLSYCTNAHAGRTVADVLGGLKNYTVPMQQNYGDPLAAGLWLANSVTQEILAMPDGARTFGEELQRLGLSCHTLNAFPFGDFHSTRVKENVYLPDWSAEERLRYTADCATILSELLPFAEKRIAADSATVDSSTAHSITGSISTVPLGFKQLTQCEQFEQKAISQLLELAQHLDAIYERTGSLIRLAIEPEPFCLLETTDETVQFFERLWKQAGSVQLETLARRYLGVCYDVCHQSVEFEDVSASIQQLVAAGIRINKVHITCAIQIDDPMNNSAARDALLRYVEPRYLHQTTAQLPDGRVVKSVDLTESFIRSPPKEFQQADRWRVHFHVPVNAETLGPLSTTRDDLRKALTTIAALDGSANDAPHLEVETYTWEVLPDDNISPDAVSSTDKQTALINGLSQELIATRSLLGIKNT